MAFTSLLLTIWTCLKMCIITIHVCDFWDTYRCQNNKTVLCTQVCIMFVILLWMNWISVLPSSILSRSILTSSRLTRCWRRKPSLGLLVLVGGPQCMRSKTTSYQIVFFKLWLCLILYEGHYMIRFGECYPPYRSINLC